MSEAEQEAMQADSLVHIAQIAARLLQAQDTLQAAKQEGKDNLATGKVLESYPDLLHAKRTFISAFQQTMQTWSLISTAISSNESQEPILVVGPNGCGKTSVIQALASLLQQPVEGCFLTPESEPTDLVGQQLPADVSGPGLAHIQWTDGAVTKAYKHGSWLLLDNLAQAEACVLERLNPLLEQPPTWLLTENAEVEPVKAKVLQDGVLGSGPASGYQLFATTTPAKQQPSSLSPALANRFTIISMPSISNLKEDFVAEMRCVASAILGDATSAETALAADMCWLLNTACTGGTDSQVTFRSLVRLLNSAYVLKAQHAELSLPSALRSAYMTTFSSCVPSDRTQSTAAAVQQLLGNQFWAISNQEPEFADVSAKMNGGHVLAASRKAHAAALLACIECSLPVLLEVCSRMFCCSMWLGRVMQ